MGDLAGTVGVNLSFCKAPNLIRIDPNFLRLC